MAKTTNIPSGALREANVGLLWQEVYNGAGGTTFNVPFQTTIRVSAGANVTVTIDAILACTLRDGEVEYFNVGSGYIPNTNFVTVVIGAGDARVQQAQDLDVGRKRPISY